MSQEELNVIGLTDADMLLSGYFQIFCHHIYEYKKGVRNLVLHTMPRYYKEKAIKKLNDNIINYHIEELDNGNINVFFGAKECIETVKKFNCKVEDLDDEQDFILGIMLGYDRLEECKRYIARKDGFVEKAS